MHTVAQPPDKAADPPPLPPHPLTYLPPARAAQYLADIEEQAALRA